MTDLNRNIVAKASVKEVCSEDDFAKIRQAAYDSEVDKEIISNIKVAADSLDSEGRPRMLMLSSWFVHEGRNRNGQAFIKEELEEAASGNLFKPPRVGMMDLDHDFDPRGLWFSSSFAFDEEVGLWGIVAEGAVWAWRFTDLANALIAESQREGHVFVSMSSLPESITLTTSFPDAEGEFTEILHNPVFYGASLLTVAPGDPNARAVVSEQKVPDIQDTDGDDSTAKAGLKDSSESDRALVVANQQIAQEEEVLMEKELETLQTKLTEAIEAKLQAEQELTSVRVENDTFKTDNAKLTADLNSSQVKNDELQVALDTSNETKAAVETKFEEVTTELKSYQTKENEATLDVRLVQRLGELPEAVARNLEQHENADEIRNAWREHSDEEWNTIKSTFQLAASEGSLVDATIKEGAISTRQSPSDKVTDLSDCIRTN